MLMMKLIVFLAVNFVIVNSHRIPDVHSIETSPLAVNHQSKSNGESVRKAKVFGTSKASSMVLTQCLAAQNCYSDLDCPGGRCLGIAVGKCNCGACVSFVPCNSDQQCGGLYGACVDKQFCDCNQGFKNAGLEGSFDALFKVCNVKECIPDTPSCHGLPCNAGLCACPF